MTQSKAKSKANSTSRASENRKSAAKTTKPAAVGKKAKSADKAEPAPAKRTSKTAASKLGDQQPKSAEDWRAATLERMRKLILEADPQMIEEVKWRKPSNNMTGVPVWSRGGIICTGETYIQVVKLTFAKGASLPDPAQLFNSSLDGGTRRAIDIREGETVNAAAFKSLIQSAVAENLGSSSPKSQAAPKAESLKKPSRMPKPGAKKSKPLNLPVNENGVVILSGGNPQIPKGDGEAPVRAYIVNMPGWKRGLGQRLDEIITKAVPDVRKAVRWNSPFYGSQEQGWFLSFHVLTKYVKVTFFDGMSLQPIPPGGTEKSKEARWIDIYEDDKFDEKQFASWVKQAAALPGWNGS